MSFPSIVGPLASLLSLACFGSLCWRLIRQVEELRARLARLEDRLTVDASRVTKLIPPAGSEPKPITENTYDYRRPLAPKVPS